MKHTTEEIKYRLSNIGEAIGNIALDYITDLEKENAELKKQVEKHKWNDIFLEDCAVYDNKIAEEYTTLQERIADLEKENAELKKVAEFQQSSNMSRHFENKKLKEGLAVGSILNKGLNSMNKALEEERDKYRNMVFDKDEQLTNAKELLNEFMRISKASDEDFEHDYSGLIGEAEQFIKDSEVKNDSKSNL